MSLAHKYEAATDMAEYALEQRQEAERRRGEMVDEEVDRIELSADSIGDAIGRHGDSEDMIQLVAQLRYAKEQVGTKEAVDRATGALMRFVGDAVSAEAQESVAANDE